MHRVASLLRFNAVLAKLFDHRVRVLIEHGSIRHRQLRRCGLTEDDLFAQLRQQGVARTDDLRYVLYEATGGLTIVPDHGAPDAELIQAGLRNSAGSQRNQP